MDTIFKIFKINTSDSEKAVEQYNQLHKNEFEELLIGKCQNLEHFIDFKTHLIEGPFVSFISQGKSHKIKPLLSEEKCEIWGIRFKSDFIPASIFQLYSLYHDNANINLKNNENFNRLLIICELIYHESIQMSPDFSVIRQLLISLFTIIESERKKMNLNCTESKKIQNNSFKNFLSLIEGNYRKSKGINFYAENLFMTTRNLNLICQEIFHHSASEIIEIRKLTEAKNLLVTSNMTISDIAYSLGFNEKTYFTHIFKKKTGFTPTEYRKEMAKLIS
ncbi:helix-turn-helix domain-containing protein [Chryseobacterium gleum]|uniref:helix-turn-helix domain-containing protein n=1 Tax=Chryseobacterium gleum TaxID=250 RepID=UPI0028B1E73E|nr:AraC family transcriptional regulator [Chryseobacterium gleum]